MNTLIINGYYFKHPFSGQSIYTRETIRTLLRAGQHTLLILYLGKQSDIPKDIAQHPQVTCICFDLSFSRLSILLWEYLLIPLFLSKQNIPFTYFSPYAHPMLWQPHGHRYLFTLHDALFFTSKEYAKKTTRQLYQYIIRAALKRNSSTVLTVSQTSATEIKATLGLSYSPAVTYNGVDHLSREPILSDEEFKKHFQITGDFILYHGGYDKRKNVSTMLTTVLPFCKKNHLQLVLSGGQLHNTDLYGFDIPKEYQQYIIQTGFVTNSELRSLYHYSACFLAPSLYEGFNINIGEALYEGTPVVAQDIPVHRELWSNYVSFVDFSDAVITTKTISKAMKAGNKKWNLPYTWKAVGQKILELLG